MTIKEDGKRIRGANKTQAEKENTVTMTVRIDKQVKLGVDGAARSDHLTQGAEVQKCIINGLRLRDMIDAVRKHLMQQQPNLEDTLFGTVIGHVPTSMQPSEAECMAFISDAVKAAMESEKSA